ncbi:hypothetical protein GGI64_004371 [Rhizobium leguminosarum]|uniref:Cyclase dehydrase n=3 Tax=Rhizobium leguminosarum TaxID=384 RepID=A0A7W9ZNB4_RHILE|nr:hypothetical protein [Rhizobium leguminosarum]ACI57974.1 conserved hypothetical protein [Rhizobium leguminosarum bv. trifolii WSM2304]EJB06762.1 hypothetical protein Rleg9DRAFT_5719 [Rhizobium leguminosarum bv. trifolii WSM597]MBB6219842.1 hypothetical protein [Rhizobium leguminosarum]NYJ13290.1 hypothetical protein [Rhizobium leguminosarum]
MSFLTNLARSNGDPKVLQSGPSSLSSSDRLARNLGWFSIGLGLAEIFAAKKITHALGMRGKENLVRTFGVREITSGFMTLSIDRQAGLTGRVAGDALDIFTLASIMRPDNHKRENAALALAMVAGITLLDIIATGANSVRHTSRQGQRRSYDDRSGFPKGVETARGAARKQLADLRPTPTDASDTLKNPASAGD